MTRGERGRPALRVEAPTLEPDEVFLARLSELAAGSVSRPPVGVGPRPGWRVGMAAASVAALLAGVAIVVGALTTGGEPAPPDPMQPATRPVLPEGTARSPGDGDAVSGERRTTSARTDGSEATQGAPGSGPAGSRPDDDGAREHESASDPGQDGEDRPGGPRGGSDDVRDEHAGPGNPDQTVGAGDQGGGPGKGTAGDPLGGPERLTDEQARAPSGKAVGAR